MTNPRPALQTDSSVDLGTPIGVDRPGHDGSASTEWRLPRATGSASDRISMIGDLLSILDPACLLAAAAIVGLLAGPAPAASGTGPGLMPVALSVSLLGTLILRDRRFGSLASQGQLSKLLRAHWLRWGLLAGVLMVLGLFIPVSSAQSPHARVIWLISGIVGTTLVRWVLMQSIRRSQRSGDLREVVAVVGAGAAADRLAQRLGQHVDSGIELLGIYDDRQGRHGAGQSPAAGNLAELIEIGKVRRIDWIVVALPETAEGRLDTLVHRLKSLSAPIGLCLPATVAPRRAREAAEADRLVPRERPGDRGRWQSLVEAADDCAPRWVVSLTLVPLGALAQLTARLTVSAWRLGAGSAQDPAAVMTLQFDAYDTRQFAALAAGFGADRYGYAVTPNADHLIRLGDDPSFRNSYACADYILLDSRFLSHMMRLTHGMQMPVCTGSDLTAMLLDEVIRPDDRLVIIGCSSEQVQRLAGRYGLQQVAHFNPPMGFIGIPDAVEACLRFVEQHSPFRFCLLAVGAPQQEALARMLKARGSARGLALCIGAAVNFLTGSERRAPLWMQRLGLEWLFRLVQAPRRMARRYLVRGPRVFSLLNRARVVLRRRPPDTERALETVMPWPQAMRSEPPRIAAGGPGAG